MAEFGSFGKGLVEQRALSNANAIDSFKAKTEAEDKLRDDIRAQTEQTTSLLDTSLGHVREVSEALNESLIEAAKTGQLTPEFVAEIKRAQAATAIEGATLIEDAKRLMKVSGAAEADVAALPGGVDFIEQIQRVNEAKVVEAFAGSPQSLGRAEAIQLKEKLTVALQREPTRNEMGKAVGSFQKPEVQNYAVDGKIVGIDVTAQGAAKKIQDVLKRGGYAIGEPTVQGGSVEDLFFSNSDAENFKNLQTQTLNIFDETHGLRMQLSEKDTLTGFAGKSVTFLAGAIDQYAQLVQAFGMNSGNKSIIDSTMLDDSGRVTQDSLMSAIEATGVFDRISSTELGRAAQKTAAARFNLTGLAFMLARIEDPNDRLSAQEVAFQLERLAMNSGKMTIGAVLDEIDRRATVVFANDLEVRQKMNPTTDYESLVVDSLKDRVANLYSPGEGQVVPSEETELTEDPVTALAEEIDPNNVSDEQAERIRKLSDADFQRLKTLMEKKNGN